MNHTARENNVPELQQKKLVKHHRTKFLNITASYALKLIVLSSESLLASFYLHWTKPNFDSHSGAEALFIPVLNIQIIL